MRQDGHVHYPRTPLAEKTLRTLGAGLATRLTLYERAGMGKSEFLTHDLMPLLRKHDFIPVYVPLKVAGDAPAKLLLDRLREAAGFDDGRPSDPSSVKLGKVKVGGGPIPLSAEVVMDHHRQGEPHPLMEEARRLLRMLANANGGHVVLILDDVQLLNSTTARKEFAEVLDGILDELSDDVKTIYSGATRYGIRSRFRDTAPPYSAQAVQLDFPPLERDFVEHLCAWFEEYTGRQIDREQAWDRFQDLDRHPALFRNMMLGLVVSEVPDMDASFKVTLRKQSAGASYQKRWRELSKVEQVVYLLACEGIAFNKHETDQMVSAAVGRHVGQQEIRRGLGGLVRRRFISPIEGGVFLNELPGMRAGLASTATALLSPVQHLLPSRLQDQGEDLVQAISPSLG